MYILRPYIVGMGIKASIECNGSHIATIKGRRFVYMVLDPGSYTFVSELSKGKNKASLQLSLEAGHAYFILQKVGVGTRPLTELELTDEITGREKLKKCSLIESSTVKDAIPSSYEHTPESLAPELDTSKGRSNYIIFALIIIILGIIFVIWGVNDLMRL